MRQPPSPQQILAAQHDAFVEALLREGRIPAATAHPVCEVPDVLPMGRRTTLLRRRRDAKPAATDPATSKVLRRRSRVLPAMRRLHRSTKEIGDTFEESSSFSSVDQSSRSIESRTPTAASFLVPDCRLQKDAGRGRTPGSDVAVEGPEACMAKLHAKTQLLVSGPGKKGGTVTVRQRHALITGVNETRSLLQLRLGMWTMSYGMLLQWNQANDHVTLVVLRKQCHESSFYNHFRKLQDCRFENDATTEQPMDHSYTTTSYHHRGVREHAEEGLEVPLESLSLGLSLSPSSTSTSSKEVRRRNPLRSWLPTRNEQRVRGCK